MTISTKWLGRLDALAHKLRLPEFLLRPICDAYERRLLASCPWPFASNSTSASTTSSIANVTVTYTNPKHGAP